MTIGIKLRAIAAGGALTMALAFTPAAGAKNADDGATNGGAPGVWVCNEAGMAFLDGTLDVIDPAADPNPPARHKTDLRALPGHGKGLVNAASHSPALALCGDGSSDDGDGTVGGQGGEGGPAGGPGGDNG